MHKMNNEDEMLSDIQDLQEFMQWCIDKGVRRAKIGDIEFEMSDYGLTKDLMEFGSPTTPLKDAESTSMSSKTMADTGQQDDEDALYWSSRP